MAISRRHLLAVATSVPVLAAWADPRRADRALGSEKAPQTAVEYFSLTCPHCAAFAREALPEMKARWITQGKLRWVFYDFPTDRLALLAAVVARYLPIESYERFIDSLFASQRRWIFADNAQNALWLLADEAGMDRATFDRAVVDTDLRDWIVERGMQAESRWHVSATPSFLVGGKLYEGAMPASEFARILGS